jgi:thiosulfate reductase cytochrome b subunit
MAFLMLTFLIVHLYLALTTSKERLGYLKAMLHGYEKE